MTIQVKKYLWSAGIEICTIQIFSEALAHFALVSALQNKVPSCLRYISFEMKYLWSFKAAQ